MNKRARDDIEMSNSICTIITGDSCISGTSKIKRESDQVEAKQGKMDLQAEQEKVSASKLRFKQGKQML